MALNKNLFLGIGVLFCLFGFLSIIPSISVISLAVVTTYRWRRKNGELMQGFNLDNGLLKVLDEIYSGVMKHSNNFVCIFDGDLGTAKSWSAVKLAYYLRSKQGKDFSLTYMVFSVEQFLELLPKLKAGDCVIFDEAGLIAMSRDAMAKENKKLMQVLMTLRSKRVFFFFCLPSFYDLDKTLAIHRADLLIHMKSQYFGQRGVFSAYFKPKLKKLFLLGKKTYSYPVKADLIGEFTKVFPLREGYEAYEDKKQASVKAFAKKDSQTDGFKWKVGRDNLIKHLKEDKEMDYKEIAEAIGNISPNAVGKIYRRLERDSQDVSSETPQHPPSP